MADWRAARTQGRIKYKKAVAVINENYANFQPE